MDKNKIILIGIGNNLLSDDRVGPYLAETLGEKFNLPYRSVTHVSLELLDLVLGRQIIYIFDSFQNPEIPIGEVVPFILNDLEYQQNPTYSHGMTIPIIFNIGEKLYPRMPDKVFVFGINVYNNQTVSESFSDEINHKLEGIRIHLLKKIQNDTGVKI